MKTRIRKIRCRKIITPAGILNGTIVIENGKIACMTHDRIEDAEDAGDMAMIPGIFDTHNHASAGYSPYGKNDAERKLHMRKYLKALASFGVTSVFPIVFSEQPDQESLDVLKSASFFVGKQADGAKVLGLHFEGPFLHRVGEHGVEKDAQKIDLNYVRRCIQASDGRLMLMGLAPELEGSDELIHFLVKNGITAAFAHSDSNSAQAFHAFEQGITVATHACNVMKGIHHREVGGLGASLLDDRVDCELICDGLHVCNDMLKLILRTKPLDQILMISDSSRFVGMPEGKYDLKDYSMILDHDGRVLDDNGSLNGSSKPVLYGIRNLVENVGLDLCEAVQLSSLNPCRKYGFGKQKGSLEEGKDVDFVLLKPDYEAAETYSEGRRVYNAEKDTDFLNPQLLKCLERN